MHTILETDCFVLKSVPLGEANKQLDLFTREFGLIRATAQGIRYLKSKVRYSLTDFSYARVSLVRGREFWRVTTASKKADAVAELATREAREVFFRIAALLRRLLQGEEPHPELFVIVEQMFAVLKENKCIPSTLEEITVLKILHALGYVKDDPVLHAFVIANQYDDVLMREFAHHRSTVIAEINRALAASSL